VNARRVIAHNSRDLQLLDRAIRPLLCRWPISWPVSPASRCAGALRLANKGFEFGARPLDNLTQARDALWSVDRFAASDQEHAAKLARLPR
jgi:hypothetical protein